MWCVCVHKMSYCDVRQVVEVLVFRFPVSLVDSQCRTRLSCLFPSSVSDPAASFLSLVDIAWDVLSVKNPDMNVRLVQHV